MVAAAPTACSDQRQERDGDRRGCFRATREGNRPGMTEIAEQLTKYLTDAHSIEEQALAQLRSAPNIAGDEELAAAYREHLGETEGHEQRIRSLLEARSAKPSLTKDTVMKLGGKGFLLFARLNPDTPGKLHAHALSYEALELSSYELLRGTAERADETEVAQAADEIATEERAMIQRLELGFDRAVDASLRAVGDDDLAERLRKYLADAHAIEEQAIALLERGPKLAGSERLASIYAEHLDETRDHAEAVEARLRALGGDPSTLKDAALRLGALNWGAFFQAHPDTAGKLAAFARAFEHLEIGGYEQLRRVAERAGDHETAQLAGSILEEEREAADRIAGAFDDAITAALEQHEISH
jgi:ferritin-like metal-binding protein YciE